MFKSAAASFTKLPPQRQSAVLLILGLSILGICDSFVQEFSDRVVWGNSISSAPFLQLSVLL